MGSLAFRTQDRMQMRWPISPALLFDLWEPSVGAPVGHCSSLQQQQHQSSAVRAHITMPPCFPLSLCVGLWAS
jgi:hypothetical protein